LKYLEEWDYRYTQESVAASIFEVFFIHWSERIMKERLPEDTIEHMDLMRGRLVTSLIRSDDIGWCKDTDRKEAVRWAFGEALELLTKNLGEEMSTWTWGSIHTVALDHVLSDHEGLKDILSTHRRGVGGTTASITVGNNTSGPSFPYTTTVSANYRQVVDLQTQEIYLINSSGQSGHPGSPHYKDHFDDWVDGCLYKVSMERQEIEARAEAVLKLVPRTRPELTEEVE
jgi:penicillin amidase